ncbi:MAG: hypothetical protein J5879_02555, partial [Clostridia bacterium]|nr:hypothetical protein [Clostridia bacterium]
MQSTPEKIDIEPYELMLYKTGTGAGFNSALPRYNGKDLERTETVKKDGMSKINERILGCDYELTYITTYRYDLYNYESDRY